jgi:predicted ATPase
MTTFDRITVAGYRRLRSVDLQLRPLNVLIGENGVGKTSLLEVFSLLAASASVHLEPRIAELGGLPEVITRDRARELAVSLRSPVSGLPPLEYLVTIAPQGTAYAIVEETLCQQLRPGAVQPFKHIDAHGVDVRYSRPDVPGLVRPNWEHDPFETSLAQVPKMYQEPERFRARVASCAFYAALDVRPRSPVRLPQPMRPAGLPGANGEDLVSCLYNLREADPARYALIEATLRSAFADFERLNFPPVAAGTLAMTWKDRSFSTPLYMHQLSEGTLRFLWLVTLLQSEQLPAIVLIDEPEVSLHPELLRLLAELLREASRRTQLLVATHSDRLIRFLKPEEVLICDLTEGEAAMTWADALDLDRWLEDYTLDAIWAMNLMGGRP